MNNKVLIAFATKCGATEDTAHQIADTLRSKYGLEVDLINLSQEAHPPFFQYGSIVIASGIRMGKWYKEASKFLENDFHNKNLALFVSSIYEGGKTETYPAAVERLEKFSKEHLSVKPFAMVVFGGRMKFAGRVTADNRDANRINAWSESLGEKITKQQLQNAAEPC
jgi:menaquinone-dependent protoporphyrinogen IX oxidase